MNDLFALLEQPVLQLGASIVTLGQALVAAGSVVVLFVILLAVALWRSATARAGAAMEAAQLARDAEMRMAEIMRQQVEMQGRMGQMNEALSARQAELNQSLGQRLDAMTGRIGQTMTEQTRSTHESLAKLQERLAVIDTAQGNIQSLAGQVVQLQAILSNKQTRGAFGEIRLIDLVRDALPPNAFEEQATLANGKRVDCVIRLPNPPGAIAIDAKFPLESYRALREAKDDAATVAARRAFSSDVAKHVRDIAEKYIVPGETADWALMFLPSEAVYAELHANFPNVVEDSHRRRVAIVSPTTLWGTLNSVRAVLKDARMKEQAGRIQVEAEKMLDDIVRLDKRVGTLQSHFALANRDIDDITKSTRKITRSGERIREVQFTDETPAGDLPPPSQQAEPGPEDGGAD
ncbi:MAG: DNA recombination protein RmuC, partial [Pseudomonadota bacterium]